MNIIIVMFIASKLYLNVFLYNAKYHTCAPLTTDWNPEPHNLFIEKAGFCKGIPDFNAVWRANRPPSEDDAFKKWLCTLCKTLDCFQEMDCKSHYSIHTGITWPKTTLSTCSGFKPADCRADVAATTDKSVALLLVNIPPIVPNGVRFAATM